MTIIQEGLDNRKNHYFHTIDETRFFATCGIGEQRNAPLRRPC